MFQLSSPKLFEIIKPKIFCDKRTILKETQIYIADGLTYIERQIEGELREVARKEKASGKQLKVGYLKISIDRKTYTFKDIGKNIWRQKHQRKYEDTKIKYETQRER